MYKSTNEGRTWTQLQPCLFPISTSCYFITAVSVASYDNNVVLAAGAGQTAVSLDAGGTWNVVAGQLPVSYCSSIRSFAPGVVYTTFSRYGVDKVWRSSNFGGTWASINGNMPDIPVNDIIDLGGKLVIATDLGTFLSEDGGSQWQRLGTTMTGVSVQKLLYHPATGILRAITHGRGFFDMQWNIPANTAPSFTSRPDTALLEKGQTFVYAPVVSGYPPATYSLVEGPSNATIDPVYGSVRWQATESPERFTIRAQNNGGAAQQGFSVSARSSGAAQWEIVSSQRMSSGVNDMVIAQDRSLWLGRDTGYVSRSLDGGMAWEHFKLPTDASVIGLWAFDKDRAIAGTGGPQSLVNTGSGNLWKTTNGGQDWTSKLYGIDSRFGNIAFTDALHGVAVSQGAKDSADIYLTSDGGETWSAVRPRPFCRIPLYGTLAFFGPNNGCFAFSNEYASPAADASILRTTDAGRSWAISTAGLGIRFVNDIAFLTDLKAWLVDEMTGRVRRSLSGGQAWSSTFYPMNGLRNTAVGVDTASRMLWIVSDTSAWVSKNEGTTWIRTQLAPMGAVQAAVFADSLHGWVVSKTGIVQRLVNNPATTIATANPAPRVIVLAQGYPNPVTGPNDIVSIPLRLPAALQIRLTLHNSMGRQISTVIDERLPAGDHRLAIETGSLQNGVYFYTISAGSERMTGRIAITR